MIYMASIFHQDQTISLSPSFECILTRHCRHGRSRTSRTDLLWVGVSEHRMVRRGPSEPQIGRRKTSHHGEDLGWTEKEIDTEQVGTVMIITKVSVEISVVIS